jgi:uroporphyrinogen decarboxylase
MTRNIKDAFSHRMSGRLPRGEFWIGTSIFAERKIEEGVKAHVAFCLEMGMDFVSIPVGRSGNSGLGYRTFNPSEIRHATESGLFVVAVLSGPFQRLVDKKDLRIVLADIAADPGGTRKAIEREARIVNSVAENCTDNGADAVMMAEDIAFDSGSFFSPTIFHDVIQPLYSKFVDNVHRRGALALFHSCGNITNVTPDIISSRFDGLSCQMECLDILLLKRTYGAQITLFTGLSREFLENKSPSSEQKQRFSQIIKGLGANGGFALSSSSGLYSSNMANNLRELYRLTDRAWKRIIS